MVMKSLVGRIREMKIRSKRTELVELLSELLANLQIPRSFGDQYLGAATKSFDEIGDLLGLSTWMSKDEIWVRLKSILFMSS